MYDVSFSKMKKHPIIEQCHFKSLCTLECIAITALLLCLKIKLLILIYVMETIVLRHNRSLARYRTCINIFKLLRKLRRSVKKHLKYLMVMVLICLTLWGERTIGS